MKPRLELDASAGAAGLSLETVPWRIGASDRITVVAKATFALTASGPATALPPEPMRPGTSELAPALPHAQITVTGHAYVPAGPARGMTHARVLLTRGAVTLLDKSILVYGDRESPADLPRPFHAMPLVHEHAPASGWNPVGRAIAKGDRPPNLVPSSPSHPIACFAPVPTSWPSRAAMYAASAVRQRGDVSQLGLFDFRWYQDAPFDQWLPPLEGDETLVLEGMNPHAPRTATELPGLAPRASWRHARGATGAARMKLDGLAVDADRGVLTLLWRGHFGLFPDVAARDVVVTVSLGAVPPALAEIAASPVREPAPDLDATMRMSVLRLPIPAPPAATAPARAPVPAPVPVPAPAQAVPGETGRLPRLTDEDIARARNPMPFRGEPTRAATPVPAARSLEELRGSQTSTRAPQMFDEHTVGPDEAAELLAVPPVVAPAPVVEPPRAVVGPPAGDLARLLDGSLGGDALRTADFSGASLANADLVGRDLRGARLRGAKLDGARLRAARLDGAELDGASLRGADLDSASLEDAGLAGADLTGATLRAARMARAVLRSAVLDDAVLDGAILESAELDDVSAVGASLERAVLRGATLRKARLTGAKMRQAMLEDVDATEAHLDGADLARSRGERAKLPRASLREARLDDAEWSHAVLDGATLVGALLVRTVATHASLVGADLTRADLREASLRAASLRDALCDATVFARTDLRGADLVGAKLAPDALATARTAGARRS